jgi:crotonobetainyl-CoA:carnitine CoA-transferase CaiB-like acyl-CoA transferase
LKTGGDVTRSWRIAGENTDDRSAYFCSVNWGKQSIAVDLSTSEGQMIVQDLASRSAIIIASYKPGDAEKLGVDYKTLSKSNPGLIYGQITGYGPDNPRVGYDAIIQAEAGFMFMNGEPGGASLKMPVALMDILASHHLKEGILLAMLEKSVTGKGKLVEVSLLQAAVASLANQASNWLVSNKLPQKQGSAHPNIAPYGDVFTTADNEEIILAVGSDLQFRNLCSILGLDALFQDVKYSTNARRVENRKTLNEMLKSKIMLFLARDLLTRCNRLNIPGGIIQNLKQVFEMPEAKSLLFEKKNLKGVKSFVATQGPSMSSHFLPPPHFGEHTSIILKDLLNYSTEKVESLAKQQVIL